MSSAGNGNEADRPGEIAASSESERWLAARLRHTKLFRQYRRAFESATGLPLAVTPPGTLSLVPFERSHSNPFCLLMAEHGHVCAECLRVQRQAEENAARTAIASIVCFAGLVETAIPVRVRNRIVAHLRTGQVRTSVPDANEVRRVLGELRRLDPTVDGARAAAGLQSGTVVEKSIFDSSVRILSIFATHLGSVADQLLATAEPNVPPSISKACAFIEDHLEEDLHLNRVARSANVSTCHFCKLFHRATGLRFKEYIARLRVERAKDFLYAQDTRISDVAFAAGFQSLSQFNRIFRRHTGESPRTWRRKHRPRRGPGRSDAYG